MDNLVNWPKPGRYVVAVSGGADSMVLMHLMAGAAGERGYQLSVAHFDHGLRPESAEDAQFVEAAAQALGLGYDVHHARLGQASEAKARSHRHAWLEQIRAKYGAQAILTAHHQDDLLETSLLNLARGSGRVGLAPMSSLGTILRPLLNITRASLRDYAHEQHIAWREDPTNADTSNPRNFLRHRLLPVATPGWRLRYLELLAQLSNLNTQIDQQIAALLHSARVDASTYSFPAATVKSLTDRELQEILVATARALVPGVALDQKLIRPTLTFIRNGRGGRLPLRQNILLVLKKGNLTLTTNGPH